MSIKPEPLSGTATMAPSPKKQRPNEAVCSPGMGAAITPTSAAKLVSGFRLREGGVCVEELRRAANEARGLAMDAIATCKSGHLGLPLGCAEIGAVLFGHVLKFNPADPKWLNRDRFVLSAGHGSMFLYAWLHLSGYALDLNALKQFRTVSSRTPGHPEFNYTPGVEATTGPLGQGVANAVGYAMSQKMAAAKFNTHDHRIFDNRIVCLCGDGCMQEGICNEAASLAAHWRLDNLILIYDNNLATLDAMAAVSQSEDTAKRFEALGWNVQVVDGHDIHAFIHCYESAKIATGKPQLIVAKTIIGKGIPEVQGTDKAHGEAGAKFVIGSRKVLGLPEERFYVSAETRAYFAERAQILTEEYDNWQHRLVDWRHANPNLSKELNYFVKGYVPEDLMSLLPHFPTDAKIATRKAGAEVLESVAVHVPNLLTGSADLASSCMNVIEFGGHFSADNHIGRNLHFGVREHAMGAICNGVAYDGVFRPSCSTFCVFSDYMHASIRVAALSQLPVVYIFTHDSVGVGEDGPTHQPVETISCLRLIPNLDVIRPADPEETAGAYACAMLRRNGPTVLALTRQVVPLLNEIEIESRRDGVAKGGYIAIAERGPLSVILMSAGSELQYAIAAAKQLGQGVRVVSIPSFFRFHQQSVTYREWVLPRTCRCRVAIEAGVPNLWWEHVGIDGKVIGVQRFGLSAPATKVLETLNITIKAVVEAVEKLKNPPPPTDPSVATMDASSSAATSAAHGSTVTPLSPLNREV